MPLNQNSFVHSEPIVEKGDRIVRGQVVADTNNTRDGTLAMGVNLLTAIMPWKGFNYEDAIVISSKAAEQLSSERLRENVARLNKNSVVSMDRYVAYSGRGHLKIMMENERFWMQDIS